MPQERTLACLVGELLSLSDALQVACRPTNATRSLQRDRETEPNE